jgi:Taurine catabolism dioxygenase TauD, TfdA family
VLRGQEQQLWHTDSSFKTTPALASVLSPRFIPENGGETEFASTRLAWNRLPDPQKGELRDLIVVHSYWFAYVTNRMRMKITGDPREVAVGNAPFCSLERVPEECPGRLARKLKEAFVLMGQRRPFVALVRNGRSPQERSV